MHAVRAGRGMVKVGSFPDDDTHVVVLKMSTGEPLRLLVVPADLDAELAPRVMALAADATNTRSPRSLLGSPATTSPGVARDLGRRRTAGDPLGTAAQLRSTFSIGRPFASSSTSLSR